MKKNIITIIILLILPILAVNSVNAGDCIVGYASGNTHSTLQSAIDDTSCSLIYAGPINFNEHLVINRELTIQGEDRNTTDLDGSSSGTVITIMDPAAVTLKDLTIQNGASPDDGGGIKATTNESLTLTNVLIKNNTAQDDGGGIYVHGNATMAITESVIRDNSANDDGGRALSWRQYNL